MLILFGYIVPILITCTGIVAIILCIKTNSHDGWVWGIGLAAITIPAWTQTWGHPEQMGAVHLLVLFLVLLAMYGKLTAKVMFALSAMVLADAFQAYFLLGLSEVTSQTLFWWRSAINIIYLYLCVITIYGCLIGQIAGKHRENRDVEFMARNQESLPP